MAFGVGPGLHLDTIFGEVADEPDVETLVIVSESAVFGEPAFDAVVAETVAAVASLDGITQVAEPSVSGPVPVAADGGSALVFTVTPTKVLAFGKGSAFTHTRHVF